MRVLVSFQPSIKKDHFEGTRLRKTIKGSLEMANVEHTTNVLDMYDIIHLMSPEEEDKVKYANDLHVPIVISALYCEDDPIASYLDYKNNDGKKETNLTPKALRFLNKADIVLVPSEQGKTLLLNQGVSTKVEVSIPGVNLSRFDFSREDEKEIFYRYFREDPSKKIVLAIGDYESMDGLNAFLNAAKKCPNAMFYYFGYEGFMSNLNRKTKAIIRKGPKNVKFTGILPNDVYRSMLLNADVVLLPGYKPVGVTTVLEAMAAKCQLIVRKDTVFPEIIKDGYNAHVAEFSETLSSLVRDYLENKIKPTIVDAYNFVSQYDLKNYGLELLKIYQKEINLKKGDIKNYD